MSDYSIWVCEYSYVAPEEMMKQVSYEAKRVIPIHEERIKDVLPSLTTSEGLRITEICLADGETSEVTG